ncbi:hypothetical protein CANARDRAFT_5003 [[Candida] arabinofermentans NRRL YB-2248]|uniref:Nudix hydrolase domain-containing protein n=1 Tax=[Candida] arabinofermentans NRRL YB-2248 TaxID=983967 RepID=A0A1E4T7F1_9ASCO|nr:hypothetical protein CANARDRAFT_5003 [[Candida] arabinofermentans NRRL YB-2248]
MSISLRDGFVDESLERVLEDLLVRFVINCPPEDLSSIERVFFQIEEAHWFYQDFIRSLNSLLPGMKMKQFTSKLLTQCPMVWQWGDPQDALARFGKYKSSIPVRGCALLNEKMDKLLLVQGTESNSWGFPRGKISKDEADVECAIRELEEETGFDCTNYINEDEYIERTIKGKNYKIYIIRGVSENTVFEPKVRNEIAAIEWKSIKYVSKACKNSNQFYLVSAMIKPLQSAIARYAGMKSEEDLKRQATIQLKKILGIGMDKQKKETQQQLDPGRELLNMLQQVAKGRHPSTLEDVSSVSTSQPQSQPQSQEILQSSSEQAQQLSQPLQQQLQPQQHQQQQLFSQYHQFPQFPQLPFPLPMPPQGMVIPGQQQPFPWHLLNPFMHPQGLGMPPHQFPLPYLPNQQKLDHQHALSHPMQTSGTPQPTFVAPAPSSFSKPSFDITNRRSKESDSKELLSILKARPTPRPEPLDQTEPERRSKAEVSNSGFLLGLLNQYKDGGVPGSKQPSKKPITILKKDKHSERERESQRSSTPRSENGPRFPTPPLDVTQPANADNAPEMNGQNSRLIGKKITLLKRPQPNDPSVSSGASELLGLLKKEEPSVKNGESSGASLLNILKNPPKQADSPDESLKPSKPTIETPVESQSVTSNSTEPKSSSSNELLNLLKNPVEKPKENTPVSDSTQLLSILKNPSTTPKETHNVEPVEAVPSVLKNPAEVEDRDPSANLLSLLKNTEVSQQPAEPASSTAGSAQLLSILQNKKAASYDPSKDLMSLLNSQPDAEASTESFETASEFESADGEDGEDGSEQDNEDEYSNNKNLSDGTLSTEAPIPTSVNVGNQLMSLLNSSFSSATQPTLANTTAEPQSSSSNGLLDILMKKGTSAQPSNVTSSDSSHLLNILNGKASPQASTQPVAAPQSQLNHQNPANDLLSILKNPSSQNTSGNHNTNGPMNSFFNSPVTSPPQTNQQNPASDLLSILKNPSTQPPQTNLENHNTNGPLTAFFNPSSTSNNLNPASDILSILKNPSVSSSASPTSYQSPANDLLATLGKPPQTTQPHELSNNEVMSNGVHSKTDTTNNVPSSNPLMDILRGGMAYATPQQSAAAPQQVPAVEDDDEELEFEDYDELNEEYDYDDLQNGHKPLGRFIDDDDDEYYD